MKKLIGILIISMFVLMSCSHKAACKSKKVDCSSEKIAHVCTDECAEGCTMTKTHAADVHVCTDACADGCIAKTEQVEEAPMGEEAPMLEETPSVKGDLKE